MRLLGLAAPPNPILSPARRGTLARSPNSLRRPSPSAPPTRTLPIERSHRCLSPNRFFLEAAAAPSRGVPLRPAGGPERKCGQERTGEARRPVMRESSRLAAAAQMTASRQSESSVSVGVDEHVRGKRAVSSPMRAAVRRLPGSSCGPACASSGRCSRPTGRSGTAERVAIE